MTAKEKIYNILQNQGYVDNYYVIDNRITTRLSDVIFRLQNERKIELDQDKCGFTNGDKNYFYYLKLKETLF